MLSMKKLTHKQKELLEDAKLDLDLAIDSMVALMEDGQIGEALEKKLNQHVANTINASNFLTGIEAELTEAMTPKRRFHSK